MGRRRRPGTLLSVQVVRGGKCIHVWSDVLGATGNNIGHAKPATLGKCVREQSLTRTRVPARFRLEWTEICLYLEMEI